MRHPLTLTGEEAAQGHANQEILVMPAKAGIQTTDKLDSRLRGNDVPEHHPISGQLPTSLEDWNRSYPGRTPPRPLEREH